MKTKQINTGIANLLLVELPEGVERWEVIRTIREDLIVSYDPQDRDKWGEVPNPRFVFDIPSGNWKLLCKADEVTEDVAHGLLPHGSYNKSESIDTALYTWNSLLQANEIWFENPYKQIDKKYFNKVHFENTQQNVWEINRTYIFKQI